jgi:hypothetical protein
MKDAYVKQWHDEHDLEPGKEPIQEAITLNGDDYIDFKPHLAKFFDAVHTRYRVVQDAIFGP